MPSSGPIQPNTRARVEPFRSRSLRGRGGRFMVPGSAFSVPSAIAGSMVGAEVDREHLHDDEREWYAPPVTPQTRNGMSSPTLEQKW